MARLTERVVKLEQRVNGASERYERDAAEFDRIIADLAAKMPAMDAHEARRGWAVAREMLRGYPRCAPAFVGMTMEDLRL